MRPKGHTLIELLVAAGMITLLMSLLAPALRSARRTGRDVTCQARQRQLGCGLTLYEVQQGEYPASVEQTTSSSTSGSCTQPRESRWWFEVLTHSPEDTNKALWCPARKITDSPGDRAVLWGNYAVNESLCAGPDVRGLQETRRSNVELPEQTLLLLDAGYARIQWIHATQYPPYRLLPTPENLTYVPGLALNKDRPLLAEQWEDALGGRHTGQTVNAIFADGHGERLAAETLEAVNNGATQTGLLWRSP
ncbi:MAG: DUF1559 domain-containing protein [Sedimentisphaerales bacterium]|nr:DUF1559 domain-containing protein [Sedimentisphaerales bacterium]